MGRENLKPVLHILAVLVGVICGWFIGSNIHFTHAGVIMFPCAFLGMFLGGTALHFLFILLFRRRKKGKSRTETDEAGDRMGRVTSEVITACLLACFLLNIFGLVTTR